MIKTTDPFPKQAKDGDLYLIETFDQVVHVAIYRHADAMNAFQELKDPTQGWPLRLFFSALHEGVMNFLVCLSSYEAVIIVWLSGC